MGGSAACTCVRNAAPHDCGRGDGSLSLGEQAYSVVLQMNSGTGWHLLVPAGSKHPHGDEEFLTPSLSGPHDDVYHLAPPRS